MPLRPNSETKLISALVNTQDVHAAQGYGVTPEMFESHRAEYEWLLSFPASFGRQPSAESLTTRFEKFPYSEAYIDVSFICSDIKRLYHHRTMVMAISAAGIALRNDDVEMAYESLRDLGHPDIFTHDRPKNLIFDEGVLKAAEMKQSKLDVPWKQLRENTGGPSDGDLWILAARLKQGKSWMLARMIVTWLLQGHGVMLFSLEMPAAQVLPRMHTILAKELDHALWHSNMHGKGFDPIGYRRLLRLIRTECPGELFIKDTSEGPVSTMHIHSMSKDCDVAVIDHLGLMTSPGGSRAIQDWRVMAEISNITKEIAISNNVPIISAAQINRAGETRGWKPPKSKDIAQSDAIGQDCDVLITMKRRSKRVMVASLEENRHGEDKILWHNRYQPNEGRFEEIDMEIVQDMLEEDAKQEEKNAQE